MVNNSFEILCVTMDQHDFSKIKSMNINSNVVFANQGDHTSYIENIYDGKHKAKMISTETIGVGKNRNIALTYATGDYCLFADDDVRYVDDVENIILSEFQNNLKADIIIFHLDTDSERKQKSYKYTRRVKPWEQMPWGTCRIAFKLTSIKKANVWFSTLFGGGCLFPSGEDSMWLQDSRRAGLKFYVSNKTIGSVSFSKSTWFTGYDEKFYFAKGAYYAAAHKYTKKLWLLYFLFRTKKFGKLENKQKIYWMKLGMKSYIRMDSFPTFQNNIGT